MIRPNKAQLVHIGPAGTDKATLSKAQKEFNRLTQKIGLLEAELQAFREAAVTVRQRIDAEYEPALTNYNQQRANLVRLFDRAHDRPEATKTEKKKLADLITNLAWELIDEYGLSDLKPIFDKYDDEGFDTANTEVDQQISEVMKEMVGTMYGIDFDPSVDVSTKEKFMAYVEKQIQAKQADQQQRRQQDEEQRTKKPKSAKQQEREAKKQAEERNITKAVRTLYMDLVKAFHPDREPDEAEKARKTEIMQRVTQAYEKSDLLNLLRLQLEFRRINQQHLETLADEQLKYYNKILKQQADELADELAGVQSQLAAMLRQPHYTIRSAQMLEFSLNNDIRLLKQNAKSIKKDLQTLADPIQMKAFLKTYKIQRASATDSFGGFLG